MKSLVTLATLALSAVGFCQQSSEVIHISSTQALTANGSTKTVTLKSTQNPTAVLTVIKSKSDQFKTRVTVSADEFRNGSSIQVYNFASVVDDGSDYSMEYRRGVLLVYSTDNHGFDHPFAKFVFGPVVTSTDQ